MAVKKEESRTLAKKSLPRKKKTSSEQLITDLEKIYQQALEAGNFTAAIKAKEIIAKELQKTFPLRELADLTDTELERLINHLEERAVLPSE